MPSPADQSRTERLLTLLAHTEEGLEARVREQHEAARRALAPRAFFGLIGLLALANLWFVNVLTTEVRAVVANLNEMYGHFATVSARMTDVRGELTAMEQQMRLMPVLGEQLHMLTNRMAQLDGDVAAMGGSVGELHQRVGAIDGSVADLAARLRALNQKVAQMGVDVEQMARPVP